MHFDYLIVCAFAAVGWLAWLAQRRGGSAAARGDAAGSPGVAREARGEAAGVRGVAMEVRGAAAEARGDATERSAAAHEARGAAAEALGEAALARGDAALEPAALATAIFVLGIGLLVPWALVLRDCLDDRGAAQSRGIGGFALLEGGLFAGMLFLGALHARKRA